MKKYYFIFILAFLFALIACSKKPYLEIKGDIPFETKITKSIDLHPLIEKYNITHLFIVTKDSTAIEIRENLLYQINIKNKNGIWFSESNTLPRTANLRDIAYIAVKSDFLENQLAILKRYDDGEYISAYEYIKSEFDLVGTSERTELGLNKFVAKKRKNHISFLLQTDSSDYPVITRNEAIHSESKNILDCFVPRNDGSKVTSMIDHIITGCDTLLVIFSSGEEAHYTAKDLKKHLSFNGYYWSIADNSSPITIIWQDFPNHSIYDIYPLLEKHTPIVLIFVDGLGWNMLENIKARGQHNFLMTLNFKPQRAPFPPRTLIAYKAISNIKNHLPQHELFVDLNIKNAYILENDQSYFRSKYPILLHTDRNNNGSIDDEIFETAMEYIEKEFDLLLVHFHSIDDFAHEYGPYSAKTRQQIEIVSSYIEQILSKWEGDFIIFSDHGLHLEDGRGRHGTNRIEDMVGVFTSFIFHP